VPAPDGETAAEGRDRPSFEVAGCHGYVLARGSASGAAGTRVNVA
jgi:hypothetical protein